jgi:hypothetical protein
MKDREKREEARAREQAAKAAAEPPKKPGFLSRLIERAHKPL